MRLKHGLSQEALAARADIDRAFLSGIERGMENPTVHNAGNCGRAANPHRKTDEGRLNSSRQEVGDEANSKAVL
jgi:transcriptional regulator with XRE-family HTH domain